MLLILSHRHGYGKLKLYPLGGRGINFLVTGVLVGSIWGSEFHGREGSPWDDCALP